MYLEQLGFCSAGQLLWVACYPVPQQVQSLWIYSCHVPMAESWLPALDGPGGDRGQKLSLVLETLHLWECPRYDPSVGLGLELAWLADPHTVSWEGATSRQRGRQSQWWREEKTQLRFISGHKDLKKKKSKHKSDSIPLSGRSKWDFHDIYNQPKLFEFHLGEIWLTIRRLRG